MAAATVPAVYATALLELAAESGARGQVVGDCAAVLAAVQASPELLAALASPAIGKQRGQQLIEDCFGGKAGKVVVDFLKLLVVRNRTEDIAPILNEVQRLADEQDGRVAIRVTTAVPLDGPLQDKVQQSIRRTRGANAEISYHIDPTLIGGIRIQAPDQVADFTVSRHLSEMKRLMLTSPVAAVWEEGEAQGEPA